MEIGPGDLPGKGRNREGVGREETEPGRFRRSEPEREGGRPSLSPSGVKLLKKKKKKKKVLVFPLQMNAEGAPGIPPTPGLAGAFD